MRCLGDDIILFGTDAHSCFPFEVGSSLATQGTQRAVVQATGCRAHKCVAVYMLKHLLLILEYLCCLSGQPQGVPGWQHLCRWYSTWALCHLLSLKAMHLPGVLNQGADFLFLQTLISAVPTG